MARDLLNATLEALSLKGKYHGRFLEDRDPANVTLDNATGLYRFIVNATINPDYSFIEEFGNRAFSRSFSRSFS